MTRLEAFTRLSDGRGRVERCERDDPQGRATMDKWCFARLQDAGVESVRVIRSERIATKGGTYR